MAGEIFLEEKLFSEWMQGMIRKAGLHQTDAIQYIAYNPDSTVTAGLPGGRNPALESLFPEAAPLIIPAFWSHMAQAYFTAPFEEAAILIADHSGIPGGKSDPVVVGGRGKAKDLEILFQIPPPHDPGALLHGARLYLGFEPGEEGRVLEEASNGSDAVKETFLKDMVEKKGEGFRYREGGFLFALAETCRGKNFAGDPAEILEDLFGPRCLPGNPRAPHHLDVAFAVKETLIRILKILAAEAHRATGLSELCLGGEIARYGPLQIALEEGTPFSRIHIPPECGGIGLSSGNALYAALITLGGAKPPASSLEKTFSQESPPPLAPEAVERWKKTALATMRRQHERLVWARHKKYKNPVHPSAAAALTLLVRQNERLLCQSRSSRLALRLLVKRFRQKIRSRLNSISRFFRGK